MTYYPMDWPAVLDFPLEANPEPSVLTPFVVDPSIRAMSLVGGRPPLENTRNPVLDALVYCALRNWGVHFLPGHSDALYFSDFMLYYHCSVLMCGKYRPTRSFVNRVKALRRWFSGIPPEPEQVRRGGFQVQVTSKIKAIDLQRAVQHVEGVIATEPTAVTEFSGM